MEVTLKTEQIEPYLRFCHRVRRAVAVESLCHALDCRLFYSLTPGSMEVCGKMYDMAPGSVLLTQPKHDYRIRPRGGEPMRLIILNFDLTQNKQGRRAFLMPVVLPKEYAKGAEAENVNFADDPRKNEPIFIGDASGLLPVLEELLELELLSGDEITYAYADALLKIVLLRLFRMVSAEEKHGSGLLRYVREHCLDPLTPESLGERFGYHPGSIGRLLRRMTGMPLHRYLIHLRLQKAADMLTDTEMTVDEIAESCGFCGSPHLCRVFRERMGLTPQAFRRRGRL